MLGVRRPSVSQAAMHLQDAGAITYTRGRVHIESRPLLESLACECYGITSRTFDEAIATWGKMLPRRRLDRPSGTG